MNSLGDYLVIDLAQGAREDVEQLGSKPKFWVSREDGRWLFKEARPNTGDDAWQMIRRIPTHRASDASKRFAHSIVCYSLNELKRIQT